MKRLWRWMFNVAAAACIATTVLWIRSWWRSDTVESPESFTTSSWIYAITSIQGRLSFSMYYLAEANSGPVPARPRKFPWDWVFYARVVTGKADPGPWIGHDEFGSVWFPHWMLVLVFGAPCVARLLLRRRSLPAGCCLTCGYDLRATPGRCPECGAIPVKKETISN